MSSADSTTTVYIGNLNRHLRILELKSSLHTLFNKILKVINITSNDISIVNGPKRYAIIDAHNEQNVTYILQKLTNLDDRKKVKFNFDLIVEEGERLHVDTVKSQDDTQTGDDESHINSLHPFQRAHRHVRKRPDYGVAVALKPSSSAATGRSSPQSDHGRKTPQHSSELGTSTDLDVTLEDFSNFPDNRVSASKDEVGEAINKPINMVPIDESTLQEGSDNSGTLMDSVHNQTLSSIHGDDDDTEMSLETSEYEDPPGSVIDLRHVSRASFQSKLTPRIHRRVKKDKTTAPSSAHRRDFFAFLDAQVAKSPDGKEDVGHRFEEPAGTPYYRPGEIVSNTDLSKEFKAYLDGKYTQKNLRDHVARCVCGFLNSGRNGMLLIGVETRGRVVGIECDDHHEGRYRQHFLDAIKEIYPPVYGEEYSINFAPLLEDNGRQNSSLKVIEVRVFPPENPPLLYECRQGVFVRRNGLLTGPIKASHIQEWVKQKHEEEMRHMQAKESRLKKELVEKEQTMRRQSDTIVAQKSEIDQQKHVIEGGKSCSIV